jgi:hypothetical protein
MKQNKTIENEPTKENKKFVVEPLKQNENIFTKKTKHVPHFVFLVRQK